MTTNPYAALARTRKAHAMADALWAAMDDEMRVDTRVLDELHDWHQGDRNYIAQMAAARTAAVSDAPPSEATWSEALDVLRRRILGERERQAVAS